MPTLKPGLVFPGPVPQSVPGEALAYFQAKDLRPGFDYRDVWEQEHAHAFTVAKAIQLDVLREAVEQALDEGSRTVRGLPLAVLQEAASKVNLRQTWREKHHS